MRVEMKVVQRSAPLEAAGQATAKMEMIFGSGLVASGQVTFQAPPYRFETGDQYCGEIALDAREET